MATRRAKLFGVLPPGIELLDLEIELYAQAPVADWKELFQGLKVKWTESKTSGWSVFFNALGDDSDKHYYYCSAHRRGSDGSLAHISLRKTLKPESEIPESVLESSRKVGGYPYSLSKMASGWTALTSRIDLNITLSVDTNLWNTGHLAPSSTGPITGTTPAQVGRIRALTWSLSGDGGTLDELTIFNSKSGNPALRGEFENIQDEFDDAIFERMEDLAWNQMMSFVTKS